MQGLTADLLSRVHCPALPGTVELWINHQAVGYIHPEALPTVQAFVATYQSRNFMVHSQHPLMMHWLLPQQEEGNALWATLAQALYQAGCLSHWRDELVPILSEQANSVGLIERTATRALGFRTQAIHLNAWTPDGLLYLALRAPHKKTDPGKWDTLAGGLLNANDDVCQGLFRESAEEAGLSPTQLEARTPIRWLRRFFRPIPQGYQHEDMLACDCILPEGTQPVNQDGEVSDIDTFTLSQVEEMLRAGQICDEAAVVILDSWRRYGY